MRIIGLGLLCIAALVSVACSQIVQPRTEPTAGTIETLPVQTATAQATQPSETLVPTAAAGAGEIVITYRKTGGIAGIDETMTVYADGRLTLTSRSSAVKQAQATLAEIDQLRQVLGSDDFARLEATYQAVGADLFTYMLIVPGSPTPRTITTMDAAKNPAVLDQAIAALEQLQAKFR
jgi:hypothetical protein